MMKRFYFLLVALFVCHLIAGASVIELIINYNELYIGELKL